MTLGVENYHLGLVARFMDLYYHSVPKYHSYRLDADLAKYVDGLGNWVRGNDRWNFEGERYLGKRGLEILQHRRVALMPKEHRDIESLDQVINDALL